MSTPRTVIAATVLLLAGCHAAPPKPAPGTGTLWGSVQLSRPALGHRSIDGGYGDRRLRDARVVDPSRPGFSVVYLEGRPAPVGIARLEIRAGRSGVRFAPESAAVGTGGTIAIRNDTPAAQLVSCPELDLLHSIEPAETWEFPAGGSGERRFFLVEDAASMARIFVSPGAFAVPSAEGRWELADLPPGEALLHFWHPRSPPLSRSVRIVGGEAVRIELECSPGDTDGSCRAAE